jgi:fatty acid desaturase
MSASCTEVPALHCNSPEFQRRVNALRTTDNFTNWFYLAREYLFLGLTVGLTIGFYQQRATWGLAWAWNVPVTALAVALVGAGQHRLATLGHEASHYLLFRHGLLNELASDFLCMFPLLSNTHHYRVQHLAHHQYVNDPGRDPDLAQLEGSGHRFHFPMARGWFVWECVAKQLLWLPGLVRYILMRARYAATGGDGPYAVMGRRSPLLIAVGVAYLAALAAVLTALVHAGDAARLAWVPWAMLAAALTFYAVVPEALYRKTVLKSDVLPRWMTFGRISYLTVLSTALAWLSHLTGTPWGLYYLVLWLLPLVTTFAFYMILRQVVQHGNAGQGRLTNTRVFFVGTLIRGAVFPLGMDYHLPHHLFPLVPHYRLKALHELLLTTEAYRQQATIIDGYFFPSHRPPTNPTVLELMAR